MMYVQVLFISSSLDSANVDPRVQSTNLNVNEDEGYMFCFHYI